MVFKSFFEPYCIGITWLRSLGQHWAKIVPLSSSGQLWVGDLELRWGHG